MRKTDDTTETPGLVLMISNAGRIVCAVVCAAPETMPSARPRCTMSVPKYETSVTRVGGLRVRDALVRAQALVLVREPVDVHGVERARAPRRPRCRCRARAPGARTSISLAEDREVGDAALEHGRGGAEDPVVVALGQHDVLAVRPGARP